RSAQAPARVTLRHNIWCGRELTGDPHTHTNREEAKKNDDQADLHTEHILNKTGQTIKAQFTLASRHGAVRASGSQQIYRVFIFKISVGYH
ncbi:hypothetical protein, partial [Roseovarius sp. D0-M9]|uniref:hypothetical protein n=1 Tax=Roseovarius sp. D0-M9 TaxID=3127117 RepID=UPI0030106112